MKPKKSLGQNFLRDHEIIDKIITSANLKLTDFVMEVGPGEGILTEKLANYTRKVLAIEIDSALAITLQNKYKVNNKIEILNNDILKINLPEILKSQGLISEKYKLIANIPYYITSPIIQLFLETPFPPSEMILMVQREVAKRICQKPGQMSILALSVQYYATPEILFYVDRKSFYPIPEVDSAVIRLTNIRNQKKILSKQEVKDFFKIIKTGFSSKRKTLANNLSNSFHLDKKEVEEKMKKIKLSPIQRAQELSIENWINLSKLF